MMSVDLIASSVPEPRESAPAGMTPPTAPNAIGGGSERKPVVVIQRSRDFSVDLQTLWHHRELLYFLVWRDVKVRYKQTLIGGAWAILQPLALMLIFTVVFSYLVSLPSDGLPYPLFAYVGLLPWTYTSQAIARGGLSLVSNVHLIGKVYFPRLLIPVAAVVVPLFDFLISLLLLVALMGWYGVEPRLQMLAAPVFILQCVLTAIAISLWLCALNAKYRDVGYTIPFLIQCWMYASPIVYPASIVPERWRLLYGLNPMVGPIEGFRWALLGKEAPDLGPLVLSVMVVVALLASGLLYFRSTERTLVDVL